MSVASRNDSVIADIKSDPLPLATFKPFTQQSMVRLLEREKELDEKDLQRQKQAQVAHLVDGELKFGVDEEDDRLPPENPDLREGCVFTKAYGAFPPRLLGVPIEEIDRGIRDKVSSSCFSSFCNYYVLVQSSYEIRLHHSIWHSLNI